MDRMTPAHLWAIRTICGLDHRGMKPFYGTSHVWVFKVEEKDPNTPLGEDEDRRIRRAGERMLGKRWLTQVEDYLKDNPMPPTGQRASQGQRTRRRVLWDYAQACKDAKQIGPEQLW